MSYQLDVNFTAICLKYDTPLGVCISVFNAFVGIGVGYTNNQTLTPLHGEENFMHGLENSDNEGTWCFPIG
jgi:hypothetical protein